MRQLFCDCKTDEEKANFFLSGRAAPLIDLLKERLK